MSAVSDKKDACGFQAKATPRVCSTCANFKSDRVLTPWMEQKNAEGMSAPERWRPKPYTVEHHGVEKNLRCKTHGFAVKKMSACRDWTLAAERADGSMPLPTGPHQAVLLTDEQQAAEIERLNDAQSMPPASAAHSEIALRWRVQANGLYAVDMLLSNLKTENEAHAAMGYVQSLFAGDEMAGRH